MDGENRISHELGDLPAETFSLPFEVQTEATRRAQPRGTSVGSSWERGARVSGRRASLSSLHRRDPPVRMQTARPSPDPREALAVSGHDALPGMTGQARATPLPEDKFHAIATSHA